MADRSSVFLCLASVGEYKMRTVEKRQFQFCFVIFLCWFFFIDAAAGFVGKSLLIGSYFSSSAGNGLHKAQHQTYLKH